MIDLPAPERALIIKPSSLGDVITAIPILRGLKKPHECAAFGTKCPPEKPLGAPMVSAEGACSAYYQYGRHKVATKETAS